MLIILNIYIPKGAVAILLEAGTVTHCQVYLIRNNVIHLMEYTDLFDLRRSPIITHFHVKIDRAVSIIYILLIQSNVIHRLSLRLYSRIFW